MSIYRTTQGDMVDAISVDHYGSTDMVEAVYDVNPGLAARGPILPAGVLITLPDAAPQPVARPIRLWGG